MKIPLTIAVTARNLGLRLLLAASSVAAGPGCAEPESGAPPIAEASEALVVNVEAELQDAFNNAACYCEDYLIAPTVSSKNADPYKEWVNEVSGNACAGDVRLFSYANAFELAERQAGDCLNEASAPAVLVGRAAPETDADADAERTTNGCWDPVAEYDPHAATPSAGFCRADFNYCIAQQLRLKADSLARPPASLEVRAGLLAEARNRFLRAGAQFTNTLIKVDVRSDSTTCSAPDTCTEYGGPLHQESVTHTRPITQNCEDQCHPKNPDQCWEVCTQAPTPAVAASWCVNLRNSRYNALLAQTPNAYDSQVTVTRTLTSTATQFRCRLDATYPLPRANTLTREKARVADGYGAVVTARIADSISQAGDLLDAEIDQRRALSDAEPLTNTSYVANVWGPAGQRTRALQAAFGERTPLAAFPEPLPRAVHRDDGPRRALELLTEHRIRLPYQRCAASEGWENLDAAGLNAWAATAHGELAIRLVVSQGLDTSQGQTLTQAEQRSLGILLLLQYYGVTQSDVRSAYDLLRDQLDLLDVGYAFVLPPDATGGGCERTYFVATSATASQRNVISSAQAVVDGVGTGGGCGSEYASMPMFRSLGAVGGLSHLRDRIRVLSGQNKIQQWGVEPSVVGAKQMNDVLLGKTWSAYSLCNVPSYCAWGTWSLLGDVSELHGDETVRVARSRDEAYCLLHGHLPGRPPGAACPETTAHALSPIAGAQGVSFSTPDFAGQPPGSRFYLFLERCSTPATCTRRLIDTLYPSDTGPYPGFSAFTTHVFGGTTLAATSRLLQRSFTNPALPLQNSLELENDFVPPLLNPLDSQGNVTQESFVRELDNARNAAQQASALLTDARALEMSYLQDRQNVALETEGAALAEGAVITEACGSNAVCDMARSPPVGLADLGFSVDPGPEPAGYPNTLSCTQFLRAWPTFSIEGQGHKKTYAENYLNAQLRCTRWMALKLASMIRFDGLPQAVVDAMPPPGWPNPPPVGQHPLDGVAGGAVRTVYLSLYDDLTQLAIALRQFNTEYLLAENGLARAIPLIDEGEPSHWEMVSCVVGKVAAVADAVVTIASAAAGAGGGGSGASGASGGQNRATASQAISKGAAGFQAITSFTECWNDTGATVQAREAWASMLTSTENMKNFYDAALAMWGKVLAADNELAGIEDQILLAAKKRDLETRLAQNTFSMDASWRAMQGFTVELARRKLFEAQRTAFKARRAVEFRTASDLRWLTDAGFLGGAPSGWAGDVFVVDRPHGAGGGWVSVAGERIADYVDNLEAFVDHYTVSHAFALDHERTTLNLREMLGGRPLPESMLFKCQNHADLLPGGHLPNSPQPAQPCEGLGAVESATVHFALPVVPSGYAATRLALHNHNYRIRSVGVNLYAFGLFDCTLALSPFECSLDNNVRYDLLHGGVVGLDNLDGEQRHYAINRGAIRDARALADESVLPNDVAIAPYEKDVFLGRPLSGLYTLTFRSRPEILWQNLENIQLHVRYEYWTSQN